MARRIALLCGGASGEREVSLLSAAAVEEALQKRYEVIKIDTGVEGWAHALLDSSVEGVFICLHGGGRKNARILPAQHRDRQLPTRNKLLNQNRGSKLQRSVNRTSEIVSIVDDGDAKGGPFG